MTRFPDGRGHVSATALVFRVALLLGMMIAFWLAAQWWNADRANAAAAFPGAERTGPQAERTGPNPLVEPISVRSADTAQEVAERIAETSDETAPETITVDVEPLVEPPDPPDTAELVSESIEEAGGGSRPEAGDTQRELRPDRGRAGQEAAGAASPANAGASAPSSPRREARGAESTAPRTHADEPRAGADSAARHELPRNSGAAFPATETERAGEADPGTTGSPETLTPEGRAGQNPEQPRRTPLPAPVKAPSTAQVGQPNAGSGPRDVHALHPEPLRLPTVTGARGEQEHEGLRSGIKAAVPVTAPD
ncbi:hypothetical protein FHR84_002060 [Actinopolyspora biskrensis]|uniref:Uncharacterized protein n=1 Tax=Actinopolyspora biskrensis TaxID=1470178 RepID=A0A852Z0F2_9ACTN|nr:hypothetical protein [Actinopolyspora biskrensis]NYH78735.1 hypothetical protein [Actinopolyspora biskrensis]